MVKWFTVPCAVVLMHGTVHVQVVFSLYDFHISGVIIVYAMVSFVCLLPELRALCELS